MKGKVLVTGAAGFIGSALMKRLAEQDYEVVGIDNLNNYYDPRLKIARLAYCGIYPQDQNVIEVTSIEYNTLTDVSFISLRDGEPVSSSTHPSLKFIRLDITDRESLPRLFENEKFDYVINLAAQAGVRYSIKNPWAYIESNVYGFLNVLECCRAYPVKHLVYASSSSVYGDADEAPFREDAKVDKPVSMYAATKKSNELMAYSYSKLYDMRTSGLRYFTVYGPWGRPDMAPMLFAKAICANKAINVFNNGELIRDFTYIDDIVNGTILTMENCLQDNKEDSVPAKVFNIGCGHPIKLMDFVSEIENALGKKAQINYLPMQQGDVVMTNADTSLLESEVGYTARTQLHEGVMSFVNWYKQYFDVL